MSTLVLCIVVAALALVWIACDAAQDTVSFHYDTSVFARAKNRQYFDPAVSWKNKYKDGDPAKGAKFFGSTTFLVWLTDFWHLIKFVKMNLLWVMLAVSCGMWWMYFAGLALHGIAFEICWRGLIYK